MRHPSRCEITPRLEHVADPHPLLGHNHDETRAQTERRGTILISLSDVLSLIFSDARPLELEEATEEKIFGILPRRSG